MKNKDIKIAVHQSPDEEVTNYSFGWLKKLRRDGIKHVVVDMKSSGALEKIADCTGIMWHWNHTPKDKMSVTKILEAIEISTGKHVFPNRETRWHFDEKVSQYYLLKSVGAPIVDTRVFWGEEDALNYVRTAKYPLVFKLSVGAGSSNVLKINDQWTAKRYVKRMFGTGITPYSMNEYRNIPIIKWMLGPLVTLFNKRFPIFDYFLMQKDYVYFQEFLPNDYDIRITVIGRRAFGFTRKNRENDFRASGSGRIVYDLDKIPLEAVKIALDVSKRCNFQSMAYDFLLDKNGNPKVGEISYGYKNSAVYRCPGYWDGELKWHQGHNWPEDLMVDDFVEEIKKDIND